MKCFIGIPLPDNIKDKVHPLIEKLKSEFSVGVKYVEKDKLHVTLYFSGELSEAQVEETKKKLHLLDGMGKIKASLGLAGFFPSEGRPHVAWIGLGKGLERVNSLQAKILEALEVQSDEDFNAHITIARMVSPTDRERLMHLCKQFHDDSEWKIDTLVFYKSEFTPKGVKYAKLQEIRL